MVLLGLAAAGLLLLAVAQTWAATTIDAAAVDAAAADTASVTGRDSAPIVGAVGLVGLAAAVVFGTAGRAVRRVAGAVLVLLAVVAAQASASVALDPDQAVLSAVQRATGTNAPVPSGAAAATGWPWVAAVAAVLLAVVAAAAIVGRGWPAPSRRYEPDGAPTGPESGRPAAGEDPWSALSRGVDPTAGLPEWADMEGER